MECNKIQPASYSCIQTFEEIWAAFSVTAFPCHASIVHRKARSACLNPSFVRREPQLNHPNSNWN
jgi:hypothetical protein